MNDVHTVLLSGAAVEELELILVCFGWSVEEFTVSAI
jgi:hypothetical protein